MMLRCPLVRRICGEIGFWPYSNIQSKGKYLQLGQEIVKNYGNSPAIVLCMCQLFTEIMSRGEKLSQNWVCQTSYSSGPAFNWK